MRKYLVLGVGALCLCACIGAAPQEEKDPGPSIKDLVTRIEALEKRLAAVESQKTITRVPVQELPPTMQGPAPTSAPPNAWSHREFNGQPVYVLPLQRQ
jgi:hypothetical protein